VLLHRIADPDGLLPPRWKCALRALFVPSGVWLALRSSPVYCGRESRSHSRSRPCRLPRWLGCCLSLALRSSGLIIGAVNTTAGSAAQIVLTQIVPVSVWWRRMPKTRWPPRRPKSQVQEPPARSSSSPGRRSHCCRRCAAADLGDHPAGNRSPGNSYRRACPVLVCNARGARFRPQPQTARDHGELRGAWQLCGQAAIVVQILFATRELGLSARGVGFSYLALGAGTIERAPSPIAWEDASDRDRYSCWVLASAAQAGCCSPMRQQCLWRCRLRADAVHVWRRGGLIFINFLALRQSVHAWPHAGPI